MDEMSAAIEAVMQGRCSEGEIGLLLTGLRLKGETVEEIAGAAAAMRRQMTPIRSSHKVLVDTCGTGGDGSETFNISTAAALVTAAAGVPVAKHGNRRVSSRTGSADVLQCLGVNIQANVATIEACLNELGICFCFAPTLHPAMRHVAEVRRKLGVPTIFNLLGPLTNPAGAPFQVIGVGRPELRPMLAQALSLLGTRRALVVCGEDGLDEVSLSAATAVSETQGGKTSEFRWQPEDFDLARAPASALRVSGPEQSAEVIRGVLDGQPGPPRDVTILNAAAALWVAGKAETPPKCAGLAAEAIDRGAAKELLARWVQRSRQA
jgi:anthranilate phosphoribosyltransferase